MWLGGNLLLERVLEQMNDVTSDSSLYERVRNGFQILFFGAPNVGKSSLMNFLGKPNNNSLFLFCQILARKSISIVTEEEGTTRDLVHYDAQLNGIPLRLIDSAGIRDTECKIEAMGVELAKNK